MLAQFGGVMSEQQVSSLELLEVLVGSAHELATVVLGFENSSVIGPRDSYPEETHAAFISLDYDNGSIYVAIAADTESLRQLSRALFAMEDEEEDLPEEDIADAIGEIANILSGKVKHHLDKYNIAPSTSMPNFVPGLIEIGDNVDIALVDVQLGQIPVTLFISISATSS